MSGMGGWIETGTTTSESQQIIGRMVNALVRFDGSPAWTAVKDSAALAVAANQTHAHLYEANGLSVGIWGRVKFQDPHLQEGSRKIGHAAILADLWRQKGSQLFSQLAGEFVCCILDCGSREAILAIDPLGTRTLYYQPLNGGIVFGTSADVILAHPQVTPEINPQGMLNYIYFHMVPGPDTIYQAQKRLLPGQYLHYRDGQIALNRYSRIQFNENLKRPFPALKQEFLSRLRESVEDATQNQQVGAFLSGGTDSSTVAGILTEVSGKPAKTYSIGFEAAGYDEMHYARIAARHFSTDHHEYYVTPDDVVEAIPKIAAIFDQPFGNASAIPAYYCARMAKADGLDTLLGGDGGDELFGGNARYAKQYIFSLYDRIPAPLRNNILTPLVLSIPADIGLTFARKARSYVAQATVPMPQRMETYNLLVRYGPGNVFSPEYLSQADPEHPTALIEQAYHDTDARSLINRMLSFDWRFTLADSDLPKVVQACHLAGMETAFPLISADLTDFSSKLPPQQKLKGTQLRYFFKKALRGFLPDEIIAKQKHGFGLPFGVWLQTHQPLKEIAADSLNDLKARHIIRPDFIDKLLNQHLHEHASYHGTMVWLLMMLEYWHKQHTST